MAHSRTDDILMQIWEEKKSIKSFLDAVFGFLKRHTDFYYEAKDNEDVGFPKHLLYRCRFDPQCANRMNLSSVDRYGFGEQPSSSAFVDVDVTLGNEPTKTEDDPLPSYKVEFSLNDYENGAKFDTYCWSQTVKDIELHVKLPSGVTSGKDLKLSVNIDSFQVTTKSNNAMILNGELYQRIKHNDVVWTVDNGHLVVNIDKVKEDWWEKFFTNEEEIDVTKLECEQYVNEYPPLSKQAIEKLRMEQLQLNEEKQNQEEEIQREMMRKARLAEKSPFKGTPFDPSLIKF